MSTPITLEKFNLESSIGYDGNKYSAYFYQACLISAPMFNL